MMGKSVMLLGKVVEYCILDGESPVTKSLAYTLRSVYKF